MLPIRMLLLPASLILFAPFAGAQEAAATTPIVASASQAAGSAPVGPAPVGSTPVGSTPVGSTPEDKHIFGVLPNYRTVEGSTPFTPLSVKQKLTIATKDTLDGPSYVMAGLFSGLYQLQNQNPSFGQGLKGYARRYASAIADQDIGNYMTEGFIPVPTHEDPRYFRLGEEPDPVCGKPGDNGKDR